MRVLVRKTAVAAACAALVLGVPATGAAAESTAITCDSDSSGQDASFYSGPSASYTYDEKFSAGPDVPGLSSYTPQGLTAWKDWDGAGNDLLLVSAYGESGQDARLLGIDPKSGKAVGEVAIAETHAGGVAVSRGWAFVQGKETADGNGSIRKYRLSELRDALKASGTPYLKQVGEAREVYASSFLSSDGNTVYAGKFNDSGRDKMYAYGVAADGTLTTGKSFEVPKSTQGLMVTADKFVYSTSYGRDKRSNLYVIDKGATDIDIPSTHCFRSPSMSEGITEYGGNAYVLYESGSYKYTDALNVIKKLHQAPVGEF